MTKQEAIDLLSLYSIDDLGEAKLDTWYHGIDEDMREALSIAIEALKTANSPCDDCQEFDCYGCKYKEEE